MLQLVRPENLRGVRRKNELMSFACRESQNSLHAAVFWEMEEITDEITSLSCHCGNKNITLLIILKLRFKAQPLSLLFQDL